MHIKGGTISKDSMTYLDKKVAGTAYISEGQVAQGAAGCELREKVEGVAK